MCQSVYLLKCFQFSIFIGSCLQKFGGGLFMLRASHRQLTTPLRGGGDWLNSGGLEFSAPQVKFFWWTAEMQLLEKVIYPPLYF